MTSRSHISRKRAFGFVVLVAVGAIARADETDPRKDARSPQVWRREHRFVDMHMHVEGLPKRFERATNTMDAVGIGVGIELGSGTVTPVKDNVSQFEKVQAISAKVSPGRFLHYMLLDYDGWDDPEWSDRAVEQINKGYRLGAAGLKEFKRLGLVLRDTHGKLIRPDDPQLDPVWKRCGELGMPVSIHMADPKAFWEPLNESNERWDELRDHPNWWFGDSKKYPARMDLLESLEKVIARHPETTFVCVHFGNNAEDIAWVDRQLDSHPNMMIDLAARIPEIGRADTEKLRAFFVKHQNRILFGTDFQVWSKLILGSSGVNEQPTDQDAAVYYQKCFRFFETSDRNWPHMTPIQGNWTISSVSLSPEVQRKVYFDNARKLLARSFPAPVLYAKRVQSDFIPDGKLRNKAWAAEPARIEYRLNDCLAFPQLSTCVRALWSDKYLYVAFEAPYTELTMKAPSNSERIGLWKDDVVELFVGSNSDDAKSYKEIEWAPNGEKLDVSLSLPDSDFAWQSHTESVTAIDREKKIWRVEARIPLSSLAAKLPNNGSRWRLNLYRHDVANDVFLAWNPTLTATAHAPGRFGWIEFAN